MRFAAHTARVAAVRSDERHQCRRQDSSLPHGEVFGAVGLAVRRSAAAFDRTEFVLFQGGVGKERTTVLFDRTLYRRSLLGEGGKFPRETRLLWWLYAKNRNTLPSLLDTLLLSHFFHDDRYYQDEDRQGFRFYFRPGLR